MENILAVAASIVAYATDNDTPVNCFELQKLLVRLQQLTIDETGQKCFAEEPEQWRSGPVFSKVWTEYKECGREPILRSSAVYELKLENMKCVQVPCEASAKCRKRVERIVAEWNLQNHKHGTIKTTKGT